MVNCIHIAGDDLDFILFSNATTKSPFFVSSILETIKLNVLAVYGNEVGILFFFIEILWLLQMFDSA